MKRLHRKLFTVLLFSNLFAASGQTGSEYHIDIYNGLPSNKVYHAIKDKNGYLWIGTDKGVVRYNGYNFKLFNLSDGLPSEHIWELVEDKKGRIWLGNISNEYGYIYNNEYHKTTILPDRSYTIYPRSARPFRDGVIFYSESISGKGVPAICIGENDTIYKYVLEDSLFKSPENRGKGIYCYINEDGYVVVKYGNRIYDVTIENGAAHARLLSVVDGNNKYLSEAAGALTTRMVGHYVICYNSNVRSSKIFSLNVYNGQMEETDLKKLGINENIQYIQEDVKNKKFYVFTDGFILIFTYEDGVAYKGCYKIEDIVSDKNVNGRKIRLFFEDSFWNKCIGSTSDGLWINYNLKNNFQKRHEISLENYEFIGGKTDYISLWLNKSNSTLAGIKKNLDVQYYQFKNTAGISWAIPYNKDTFLLASLYSYYFTSLKGKMAKVNNLLGASLISAIRDNNGDIYLINIGGLFHCVRQKDSFVSKTLDLDRYNGLVYDSIRKDYWAYNFSKVYVYSNGVGVSYIKDKLLTKFGVRKVESVTIDNKYGNIFLKGPDGITNYDPDNGRHTQLFPNFNLKESSVFVYNNTLIVAGRFGVLFSKILGIQNVSDPIAYLNVKNINYDYIYGCDVSWGKLILNTDNGVYTVDIPTDSEILSKANDNLLFSYKLVLNYRDSVSNFKSRDTIVINQNFRRLEFDVINPLGSGSVKYTYLLPNDSVFHELNANELELPNSLVPNNYYKLSLKVYDDVWRSKAIDIFVYIQPYWYQTSAGQRVMWFCIVLLVLLLLTGLVLVTRRLVLRANQKRNRRLELELRSIYAQLNPHFVFNTLNSALHFIKKERFEDAFVHISKFSRLLRSYLDSSKNRYISLIEEIGNLRNYIEIQQTRFSGMFAYEIIVHNGIRGRDDVKIPSLLLQPIVENAITHGLVPKEAPGHLIIEFENGAAANEIICIIDDDGIGRNRSKMLKTNSGIKRESLGDSLVNELVGIFNKYEKMQIELAYIDKEEPLTGTTVILKIKDLDHE